ncbi:MAG: hypothetical protein A2297_08385 [Elusimicrobia bacterium RIFOXYB2_FULL_48_7]|nr:MAG: hypothetical protein A2297_08385 [Elusimicrobia bacterium RIFOXYB2_FULL_48_7]
MDKKNLIFILIVDLLVIFFAFSVIYTRYQKYHSLKNLPQSQLASTPKTEAIAKTAKTEEPEAEEKRISKKPAGSSLRNILFQYKSSKAKNVQLIGDFNDWKSEPLSKSKTKPNTFELAKKIKPGSYAYNYLVNGKVILDPNNRKPPVETSRGYKSSYLELKAR